MIYSDIKYSKSIKSIKDIEKYNIEKRADLSYEIINNGYILPHRNDFSKVYGIGGVMKSNGDYVESSSFSLIMNSDNVSDWGGNYSFDTNQCDKIDETLIFGGFINNNEWGHFIVDWSTRLWYALREDRHSKIVFCSREEDMKISRNILKLLRLGGIDNNRILVLFPSDNPLYCSSIIIPQQSLCREYYNERYFQLFRNAVNTVKLYNINLQKHDKLYLTRTKLVPLKEIGEKRIEKLFFERGYYVIAPEQLSVEEQIFYMSTCSKVASIEGSAAHNIVFGIDNLKHQIILEKTRDINFRQIILNQIAKIKADYVGVYPNCDLLKHNKENIFIVNISKELSKYLGLYEKESCLKKGNILDYLYYIKCWLQKKLIRVKNKMLRRWRE